MHGDLVRYRVRCADLERTLLSSVATQDKPKMLDASRGGTRPPTPQDFANTPTSTSSCASPKLFRPCLAGVENAPDMFAKGSKRNYCLENSPSRSQAMGRLSSDTCSSSSSHISSRS